MFKKLSIIFCLLSFSLIICFVNDVEGSKILAVYPFPGKSHYSMTNTLIKELVQRGHQVTMITAFTLAPLKLGNNYTEILIEPVYDFWTDMKKVFKADNLFEMTDLSVFDFIKLVLNIGLSTTEHALKQPKVQQIINAKKTVGVFDLLLAEQFYQEAFLSLSYIYKIPIVTSSTLGISNTMSQQMGVVTPWSFVPHGFSPYTDHMTFWERLQNTYISLYEDLDREFNYFPKMDALVQKYFSHLPVKFPKVSVMEKTVSVMLQNKDIALNTIRPITNSIIAVGGLHIYPPKPLPTDIQKFLDEAADGAIYFSLGSNLQSKDMPPDNLKMFLEVFAGLKQRVIWKFEDERMKQLPMNIMVKKWMPQSDILAHPNVKVFITHGGLFGTQEGVHHGVPMLGMPVYCDQHLNMKKAVLGGYGISLHFQSITKEILKESLQQLMQNSTYKENVKRISNIFRDRPENPRETAMYWIEYVIRHKGAKHLRSAALDLKWYQLYLLDVVAFIVGTITFIVIIFILLIRRVFKNKNENVKKIKKN